VIAVGLAAVIAVAAAAGFVAWLVHRGDGGSSGAETSATGAYALTAAELASLAGSVAHPIFWLGPKRDVTYEVTQTANGNIYVRYLPAGVDVGSKTPYLAVGTYPFPGAYAAVRKQAAATGAVTARLADGGIALLKNSYPQSVYIAYPGVDYQVEVYDPTPARAMRLVAAGELARLGRVRKTAAPAPGRGAFASSDPLLNRIWAASVRTAREVVVPGPIVVDRLGRPCPIELETVIVDAPVRDRCPYIGDLAVVGKTLLLDDLSHRSVLREMIRWFASNQHADGAIPATALWRGDRILFDYNGYWVETLYDYVLATGDRALASETWPSLVGVLDE
jgi:hypothetical protein